MALFPSSPTKWLIHTGMCHSQVFLHPHHSCICPGVEFTTVSLVAILLVGIQLILLGKLNDPTIKIFCFHMQNTGLCHFLSQGGQALGASQSWTASTISGIFKEREQNLHFTYTHLPDLASSPELWQSVPSKSKLYQIKYPYHSPELATSPSSLNFLPPIVQLHWK